MTFDEYRAYLSKRFPISTFDSETREQVIDLCMTERLLARGDERERILKKFDAGVKAAFALSANSDYSEQFRIFAQKQAENLQMMLDELVKE